MSWSSPIARCLPQAALAAALTAALTVALTAALPAQVPLREVAALARARAERLRPEQEQKLEPFWKNLVLDYRDNAQFLDPEIARVARLGDSVVPLLLEKLQPVAATPEARNLAGNCRRVLEQLDPASFLDALIELLGSGNAIARQEAIRLLGHASSPRAAAVLLQVLDQGLADERLPVLAALRTLRAGSAVAKVTPLLGSSERNLREAVLDYLIAVASPEAIEPALQALSVEKENRLLPLYIELLAATAREHDAAARALLPLLERDRLFFSDVQRLVQALAKVAPKNHEPTQKRLHEILDGDDGVLGLEAALTLRALGDKTGVKKLKTSLNDQLRTKKGKDADTFEKRGNLSLALEDYEEAGNFYEKVIEFAESPLVKHRTWLNLARCEAHGKRWGKVFDYLKLAAPSFSEVQELAKKDPAVQEALQNDRLRQWLQALQKERDKGGSR